jgi:sigma-B regulation protein RsbU (phosphoserine phosphatase)
MTRGSYLDKTLTPADDEAAGQPAHTMARELDISSSRSIAVLTRLVEEMGRVSDPLAAHATFARAMREAYDELNVVQISTAGLAPGQYRIFVLRTQDGVEHVPETDPWECGSLPVREGGFFGALLERGEPCIVHDLDLSRDAVLGGALGRCRSLVAAPVVVPDLPLNWLIMLNERPEHFRLEHLEELILRSNLAGALIRGLQASQQLASANQQISREIEQIARIQRTLLPSQLPKIPGLRIVAHYETFDQAGGDLYDFARMEGDPTTSDDDRWAVLIADASGHGPAAATVCAIVHSILHAYPREPSGPAELLRHVNRHLCAKRIECSFVTAFLAFYQASTRELVYARAGHNPPLLLSCRDKRDGGRCLLRPLDDAMGLPLGIDADAPFNEARLTLAEGQMVLLYTDGIVEAKGEGDAFFGVEGIEAAMKECADDGADAVVRCLNEAVGRHLGSRAAGDDRTILVLEATPMPGSSKRTAGDR